MSFSHFESNSVLLDHSKDNALSTLSESFTNSCLPKLAMTNLSNRLHFRLHDKLIFTQFTFFSV